jgi:hypothetical protein
VSVPFVGEGRIQLVERLASEFDRVCRDGVPQWWSLEANTGWRKTRIIQEFYARLAAAQGGLRYWPESILTPDEQRVNVQRKRVHPPLGPAPAASVWAAERADRLPSARAPLRSRRAGRRCAALGRPTPGSSTAKVRATSSRSHLDASEPRPQTSTPQQLGTVSSTNGVPWRLPLVCPSL